MAKNGKVVVFKKAKSESKQEKQEYPVEVLVYDCVAKQRVVGSYSGESKWWFGTRLYKVYHPGFDGGFRWVMKLGRILGSYNENEQYPTAKMIAEERNVIQYLMADEAA